MRVAGSNRFFLNPSDEETLAWMARDRPRGGANRAGEGEISDGDSSASLEEISAEDFKQDAGAPPRSKVWVGYPMSRNYAPNLYSFAWAQAVQNKPLGLDLKPENGSESEEKELDGKETEEIGEFDRRVSLILEELETVTEEEAEKSFDGVCSCLRQSFEMLKPMFAETESPVPVLDALVQQAFAGIKTVHSVLSSENLKKKEQNKDLLLRLLIHIKNQYSNILSPEQVKEIDTRVQSLVFEHDSYKESKLHAGSGINTNDKTHLAEKSDISSHNLVSSENSLADSSIGSKNVKAGLPKLDIPTISRGRVVSPLLDLHAEYDEENLPSPTRENAPPLPIHKPIGFGTGTVPITPKNVEAEDDVPHPYITDAFKAVSSYQQKYFFASNRLPSPTPSEEGNDKDDAHDEVSSSSANSNAGCVNTTSQIQVATSGAASTDCSSSHQPGTVKPVGQLGSAPNLAIRPALKSRDPRLRFVGSESGNASDSNIQVMSLDSSASNNGPVGGITNPRKHKAVDESFPENHTLKRQRNGLTNSGDVHMIPGRGGGWLEDSSAVDSQPSDKIRSSENMEIEIKNPGSVVGSDRRPDSNPNIHVSNTGTCPIPSSTAAPSSSTAPSSSAAASISFPSLLKDIAVNPTMLMQLIQMEQQRLSAEAQQKNVGLMQNMAHASSVNVLSGAVSSANVASMKSTEVGQNPAGRPQVPAQTVSTSDVGRIRMKPRDPRRILHNMVQKNETVGSERAKPNGTLSSDPQSSKDHLAIGEQGEQVQATTLPAQQFAKNPKNLGDISSTLQSTTTPPAASQIISQPIQLKINKVDPRPAAAVVSDPKTVSAVTSEGSTTGPTPSTHPWGDVDHLLDGYDDQQKAAIQRERARRIAEQNNMFAARKLCLVLDLDHTLLNSAKFVEVDPVHEEILRKKEEQDREKPQRHLFRFQHMGMWTKLRPGIWNFLEKASKLYEMHLYTMGNKLYATEMAKVLDPTGTLFAGRVISRGDDGDPFDGDERVPKSKDLDGVLGMESAVVIIDDSVRVWPHNKLNLIVVERYTYFPCSRRQFGLFGPSLLEIDHDERPEDGTLASSLAVIERIHHNFFSHRSLNDIDVRNILAAEQHKILGGCKIVFSRVFPVGEANPHLHPLWQMAEQFGAVCTNQIDEQVTHVVANSLGTDKVNWALSTGRFVVHPGWVEASALLYRRVNEQDFAVK
ncbi:RNA polymerase II C-terminal domain phosphatase-like 3 [Cocos nucifera]|uniref:protein-serine/threonine phosphatase n=1 Tax=Cocos nucifera TaxID=13894 RepID=A0A8K0IXC6_COCNU|nr:RNA polymerase II C-terminal domain phosphatase-like 3 [Cocos nucifera]